MPAVAIGSVVPGKVRRGATYTVNMRHELVRKIRRIGALSVIVLSSACVADPPEITGGVTDGSADDAASNGGDGGTAGTVNEGGPGPHHDGNDSGGGPATGSCGSAPDAGGIPCGGASPICCAVQPLDGASGSTELGCASNAASCSTTTGGVVVGCRSRLDCGGGEVCCGRKLEHDTSAFATVKCESNCDGAYTYAQTTFCDPGDPHVCDKPDGFTYDCSPSDILPGLYACSRE